MGECPLLFRGKTGAKSPRRTLPGFTVAVSRTTLSPAPKVGAMSPRLTWFWSRSGVAGYVVADWKAGEISPICCAPVDGRDVTDHLVPSEESRGHFADFTFPWLHIRAVTGHLVAGGKAGAMSPELHFALVRGRGYANIIAGRKQEPIAQLHFPWSTVALSRVTLSPARVGREKQAPVTQANIALIHGRGITDHFVPAKSQS